MKGLTLSVSQLNDYVRRSLASDPLLRGLCVTGEISNLKRHVSGHWYFTLKDEEAAINCAMFRQSAMSLRFRPENGQPESDPQCRIEDQYYGFHPYGSASYIYHGSPGWNHQKQSFFRSDGRD